MCWRLNSLTRLQSSIMIVIGSSTKDTQHTTHTVREHKLQSMIQYAIYPSYGGRNHNVGNPIHENGDTVSDGLVICVLVLATPILLGARKHSSGILDGEYG